MSALFHRFSKIIGFLAVVLLIMSSVSWVAASTDASPSKIRPTWSRNDTSSSMNITWWTATENSGDKIFYDNQSQDGDPQNYAYSEAGIHHSTPGFKGYLHDVEITGLEPDTTYYFVCGGDNGGYSKEWSFHTMPSDPDRIKFVASADTQEPSTMPSWPENRNEIMKTMVGLNPSFVLHGGDWINHPGNQSEWDNLLRAFNIYLTNGERLIPFIAAVGNHELDEMMGIEKTKDDCKWYYEQFSLPGRESWYSLDFGNLLHITVLDTNASYGGEQLEWLENDLANTNAKWKVALFHEPPYVSETSPSGHNSSNIGVREQWCPVFEEYGVNLVINGHKHYYERAYPINLSISENSAVSPNKGVTYIECGSWGSTISDVSSFMGEVTTWPDFWWKAHMQRKHNFLFVNVKDNTLRVKAMNSTGRVFDEVTLLPHLGVEDEETPSFPLAEVGMMVLIILVGGLATGIYLRRRD